MPTCLYYLSIPTVYASCPCYCLCLPICNLGERSAQSKALPDLIDRLIVLIQIILYGCLLAVHSNSSCLGCFLKRPWFDLATGRYRSSGSIQSIDRLNHLWCLLAGYSNGRRLVLVTVVWFWWWSSPTCLPARVSIWFNLGEGSAQLKALIDSNCSLWAFAGCTFERWSSGVPP